MIQFGSLIGFVTQVIQVSMQYFAYETVTKVKFETPHTIQTHSVALCFRYADIIEAERLKKDTGLSFKPLTSLESGIGQEDLLTVQQIFNYTPDEHTIFSCCQVRGNNWMVDQSDAAGCYEFFKVDRFFTLEFMCYRIRERVKTEITLESVTQSSFQQYKVFEITLSEEFWKAVFLTPIVFVDGYPFLSRDYTSTLPQLRVGDSYNFTYNIFGFYPSDVKITYLPAPFDTNCQPAKPDTEYVCKRDCLIEEYAKFGRAPGYVLIIEPSNYTVFSVKDQSNKDILEKASAAYTHCHKKCMILPCEVSYSKTTTKVMQDSNKNLRFSLLSSMDADIAIKSVENMSFIAFFSYIAGCLGTWFGLSFLSVTRLRSMWRKRERLFSFGKRKEKFVMRHEPWRLVRTQR